MCCLPDNETSTTETRNTTTTMTNNTETSAVCLIRTSSMGLFLTKIPIVSMSKAISHNKYSTHLKVNELLANDILEAQVVNPFKKTGIIACGTKYGSVKYYSAFNGKERYVVDGHTGYISGITISKDGKNIYFSDSFNRTIYKYNNSKNLNLIKSEKFYEFKEEDGFPDGLTVDINGNIWVAHWSGGKISQISSSGKLLKEIKLPSMNITSLCFGGDNFKELFITSAKEEVSESEFKKFSESGSSFLISPNSIGYESEIWES